MPQDLYRFLPASLLSFSKKSPRSLDYFLSFLPLLPLIDLLLLEFHPLGPFLECRQDLQFQAFVR